MICELSIRLLGMSDFVHGSVRAVERLSKPPMLVRVDGAIDAPIAVAKVEVVAT
jgi:hypothetical protein